uniref:Uncharacterized protein n=1 Tax=Marseillevirus LCMAC102 TaxID=2506603 RepID=A0A481YTW1_9VIRU|nr:MAG: hypothetical protein LCMAC102_01720 [Marseillevirus LCMAC102]
MTRHQQYIDACIEQTRRSKLTVCHGAIVVKKGKILSKGA